MNRSKMVAEVQAIHCARMDLLTSKGADYAHDEDALANFKRMRTICAQLDVNPARSPADCALFLALLKLDRWCNLRRKGTEPKHESVQDTVKDLHNYIDLAYLCSLEKEE